MAAPRNRHSGESRHPGILATLGLYSAITLLDSGLRRNDPPQADRERRLTNSERLLLNQIIPATLPRTPPRQTGYMRVNEQIRYEPGDNCPPLATLNVALQGVVIALSNAVSLVTIFAVASQGSESYLAWAVFAALVIAGAVTALQSGRIGRLGSGYILLMGPGAPFLGVCVLAVSEAGLPVMASLIVAASLVQFAMAFWLAQLRRIITPVVSGVAFMVLAAGRHAHRGWRGLTTCLRACRR